ncbi:hypothetical protein [Hyalangium versicolor]|uniref:hypothetical protein n=1 Tax=Hyalangium versicolor TaxID=2861190 RepID=UPI001CCA6A98|nr:hypothetical protein [Hyalangium versicolor]
MLVRTGRGAGIIQVSAGAAHNEALPPGVPNSHGYSFGTIDFASNGTLQVKIWPRRWSDRSKEFVLDVENTPEGEFCATHALSGPKLAAPAPRGEPLDRELLQRALGILGVEPSQQNACLQAVSVYDRTRHMRGDHQQHLEYSLPRQLLGDTRQRAAVIDLLKHARRFVNLEDGLPDSHCVYFSPRKIREAHASLCKPSSGSEGNTFLQLSEVSHHLFSHARVLFMPALQLAGWPPCTELDGEWVYFAHSFRIPEFEQVVRQLLPMAGHELERGFGPGTAVSALRNRSDPDRVPFVEMVAGEHPQFRMNLSRQHFNLNSSTFQLLRKLFAGEALTLFGLGRLRVLSPEVIEILVLQAHSGS